METLKTIWDFFQNEVLGMNWLNRLIETFLNACGLDTTGKIGGSVQFFIYDKKLPSLLSEVQKGNKHQCSGYESHACRTQIRFLCMPPHG